MASCKQDAKREAQQDAPQATTDAAAASSVTSGTGKIKLACEDLGMQANTPHNAVYAIIEDRKTKIMEINAACAALEPQSYADYGVPADALAALSSWYAGLGDYFYAKQEGEKIVFYHSVIGEEMPPGGIFTYYPIATYENGKVTLQEEPTQ